MVHQGRLQHDEANSFIRGAAIAIPAVSVALGVISLWAGYADPTCAKPFSFADAPTAVYNMVVFASWGALWLWVCKGPGADLLARMGAGLSNGPEMFRRLSARSVRTAITLFILLSAVGAFVATRIGPTSPSCAG